MFGGFLHCSWVGGAEVTRQLRGEQNSFPVSLSTLSGLLGRRASRCLSAELQWILHKKLQAGGKTPGSQLQPTDSRFDSLSLDTLTGITSTIICQSLFIFQWHGQYLLVLRFSLYSSIVYHTIFTYSKVATQATISMFFLIILVILTIRRRKGIEWT